MYLEWVPGKTHLFHAVPILTRKPDALAHRQSVGRFTCWFSYYENQQHNYYYCYYYYYNLDNIHVFIVNGGYVNWRIKASI